MIDDATQELLSRLLDGDLDRRERDQLVRRIASDEQLRAELAALERLREAVAEIAGQMDPPRRLDALVEPLRRGPPPPARRAARAARWLAVAAAAVVGITVVSEVGRREPGPSQKARPSRATPRTTTQDRRLFQLQPLPTSRVPPEEVPVGAADRLLARPLPEPRLEDPEPLEIVGPLSEPISERTRSGIAEGSAAAGALQLDGSPGTREVALRAPLPPGRYPLLLTVAGGRIREVTPTSPTADLAAALVGIGLGGISDGEHRGELVVDGRPAP